MLETKNFSVELNGRLGNQLFGIALLVTLENKLDTKGYLNINRYLDGNLDSKEIITRNRISIGDFYQRTLKEKHPFNFDNRIYDLKPNTLLKGYFQSLEYFYDNGEKVGLMVLLIFASV
jgi:hypothetical protein